MERFGGGRRSGLVLALVALVLVCCFSSGLGASIKINNDNVGKFLRPFASATNVTELGKEMLAIMNTTVDPCTDFYEYSCGSWLSSFPLPSDASRFALATDSVNKKNLLTLQKIVADPSGEWPVIGPFYNSCMNMDLRDELDYTALEELLSELDGITSVEGLMVAVGVLHNVGVPALFSIGVSPDEMNPSANMLQLSQGGLSLDVPDDYNATDNATAKLDKQFIHYVANLTSFVYGSQSRQYALDVFTVEQTLASASADPADMRDPYATYNNLTLAQLYALTPNIPAEAWQSYFKYAGIPLDYSSDSVVVNVAVPKFFAGLSSNIAILTNQFQDFSMFSNYLRYKLLDFAAPHLSTRFVDAHFNFYGTILSGQQQNSPLWKRCVQQTDVSLGELLGRYFVSYAFSPAAKGLAEDMMTRIENAFRKNLPGVDWMDDVTRKLAEEKLSMVAKLIGYPEHWKDYSDLNIDREAYLANVLATSQFAAEDQFAQLPLPVDRYRWEMTTPTVNAYYEPSLNEIVFPAGILQSPWFFDVDYPPQINYGGTASAMGHELTHGFDDQGANYDGTGRLHQWWPQKVKDRFVERTQCVADLYSGFEVLPGLFLNGNLTLGENVADIGGLHASYVAYADYAASLPTPPPEVIPGINDKQLFFIAYAISWCEIDTPEALTRQVKSNPHSPAKFRVNGPVSQLPAFAEAFKCPATAPLNPPTRCNVW